MTIPNIPNAVDWRAGMVLEPDHFQTTDRRTFRLAHLAALTGDPWPWGLTEYQYDPTALASGELRLNVAGVFPGGQPFRQKGLTATLGAGGDGAEASYSLLRKGESDVALQSDSGAAPSMESMPVSKLAFRGGVWGMIPDWSPPAMVLWPDHPMRSELLRQIGSLSALAGGFMATLRLPGAEERPTARTMRDVASLLNQGVGVLEAMLSAPAVSPGRLGLEALRLALGVRSVTGEAERLTNPWDPADQQGSLRQLLWAAEQAASGIGLPFRSNMFRPTSEPDVFLAEQVPAGRLLLAIEGARPADIIAARTWFEGAALAAPDRIREALVRRVGGAPRQQIERDPQLGVSAGPLLALYQVEEDSNWRTSPDRLALAAATLPPPNVSFSLLIPEDMNQGRQQGPAPSAAPYAGGASPMGGGPAPMGAGPSPLGSGPPPMGSGPPPMGSGPPPMGSGPPPMGAGPPPVGGADQT